MSDKKFDPKKLDKLNNPGRLTDIPPEYIHGRLNMGESKIFAETLSPDSNKNIVNIYNPIWVRKETLDIVNELISKMRDNGIIVYDSAQAAAKSIYRLWSYGNYLKNRGFL